ncbi:chondroitin proteoglycan 1-like [Armigeres subalbatus]|uniref:chondroitin proteoglycan 1-like n=1 Tax=Armigeres subalbatus TaxID=124917 RepID=UPI002ED28065
MDIFLKVGLIVCALSVNIETFRIDSHQFNTYDIVEIVECVSSGVNIWEQLPHEYNCQWFISCMNGVGIIRQCPDGFYFDPDLHHCDLPGNVNCESITPTTEPELSTTESTGEENSTTGEITTEETSTESTTTGEEETTEVTASTGTDGSTTPDVSSEVTEPTVTEEIVTSDAPTEVTTNEQETTDGTETTVTNESSTTDASSEVTEPTVTEEIATSDAPTEVTTNEQETTDGTESTVTNGSTTSDASSEVTESTVTDEIITEDATEEIVTSDAPTEVTTNESSTTDASSEVTEPTVTDEILTEEVPTTTVETSFETETEQISTEGQPTNESESTDATDTTAPATEAYCEPLCAGQESEIADPEHCDRFISCIDKCTGATLFCPSGLYFNHHWSVCDLPERAECLLEVCSNQAGTLIPSVNNCRHYYGCTDSEATLQSCEADMMFDATSLTCVPADDSGTCAVDDIPAAPQEVYILCTQYVADQLIPHPTRCDVFYRCVKGKLSPRRCLEGLLFDSSLGACNLETNVECDVQ